MARPPVSNERVIYDKNTGTPSLKLRKKAWAKLIRQVFEVDPLKCPACDGELKIVTFVEKGQRGLINKILDQIDEPRSPLDYNRKPRWFLIKDAQEQMNNWDNYCIDPVYEDEIA